MKSARLAVSVPVGAPDGELCQRATALVADLSPPFLFNHCARSFLFADAIGFAKSYVQPPFVGRIDERVSQRIKANAEEPWLR